MLLTSCVSWDKAFHLPDLGAFLSKIKGLSEVVFPIQLINNSILDLTMESKANDFEGGIDMQ